MTRRLSVMLLVLAALALTFLGACSGGSKKSCPPKVDTKTVTGGAITVCGSDNRFDVDTIKTAPGPLTVTLENGGAIYHTLAIKGTSLNLKANPGKSDTGTVTLAKGTYLFDCTVAGHAAAGMKGKVVVG